MSDTPRTDAVVKPYIGGVDNEHIWEEADKLLDHARKLERELNAALALTNINVEAELLKRTEERDQLKRELAQTEDRLQHWRKAHAHCSESRDRLERELGEAQKLADSLADDKGLFRNERDAWRKVAGELFNAIRNGAWTAKRQALAAYEKLKGEK